jgi:hypothetical protein
MKNDPPRDPARFAQDPGGLAGMVEHVDQEPDVERVCGEGEAPTIEQHGRDAFDAAQVVYIGSHDIESALKEGSGDVARPGADVDQAVPELNIPRDVGHNIARPLPA